MELGPFNDRIFNRDQESEPAYPWASSFWKAKWG